MDHIGSYEVLATLGQGSMGVVYKARDPRLNRLVAIKTLLPATAAEPEVNLRFLREARAASALNHPNIVTVHEISEDSGTQFIVMEFVAGRTLRELLHRRLRTKQILEIASQVAGALAAAHAAGIVHRDLKPENIMVTDSGAVKVLDFGLAKLTERDIQNTSETLTLENVTERGAIAGTPAYMSPEQAEGKQPDVRSDVFSFGSMVYEMVAGRAAFTGGSTLSILAAVLHQEPQPLDTLAPETPRELQRLIARCMRKEPARRWQSMADVRLALDDIEADYESGILPAPWSTQPERAVSSRRRAVALCATAIAAAGVAWFAARAGSGAAREPLQGLPITSAPGLELEPSLSPDGNQVAYSWNGEARDNFDIYVKLLGPGTPLRLTTNPGADTSPAWSRDGRYIAFLRQTDEEKSSVIVIPSLGGPERRAGEVAAWPYPWRAYPGPHLTWTRDGKGLIVSDRKSSREPFSLYFLSLESGESRKITSPPEYSYGDTGPALSPDGITVVFRRCLDYGAGQLYRLSVNERLEAQGEPDLLTPEGISAASPAWTSDGRSIVYTDGYYFEPGLKRLTLPRLGKAATSEWLGFWGGAFPATSLRAAGLVYTQASQDANIWEMQLADGAGTRSLIASTQLDSGGQYSPDGKHIAFLSRRSGGAEIWMCDREGNNATQLTSFGDAAGPRWSPDNAWIAFLARYQGLEKIYVVRASGGQPRRVTSGPGRDQVPSWSRDGKFLYFSSSRSGDKQCWKVALEGGDPVRVTQSGGELVQEAADGTLYYSKLSGYKYGLWKKTAGGQEAQVGPSLYFHTNFAVGANGVYFTPHPKADGSTSIERLRYSDGQVETIAKLPKPLWFGLSVSPDERSILYSQVDLETGNLRIVERFR